MSTLTAIRAQSKARETEEKRIAERRRNTLVLILRYLRDQGYLDSSDKLSSESNVSLNKFDAADNVDLYQIITEYEDGYEARFGRRPKLTRKMVEEVALGGGAVREMPNSTALMGARGEARRACGLPAGKLVSGASLARERRAKAEAAAAAAVSGDSREGRDPLHRAESSGVGAAHGSGPKAGRRKRPSGSSTADGRPGSTGAAPAHESNDAGLGVVGAQVQAAPPPPDSDSDSVDEFFARRVVKPLPDFPPDLRDLALSISRDIYLDSPNVRWDDIAGLQTAKKLLLEAVVQPIKYPQFFTGLLSPWRGILLYGPPGTGKTLLAKAVATECRTTFFNISASSIISKWRGDSEKLVRVLFELARHHAPSTVFLDELDAIMASRGGDGEHEASRRMKTELLIQMDGIARGEEQVFLLAATNLPWELDMAMLRRLEKRILVPLPTEPARAAIFTHLLSDRCGDEVSVEDLAARTEGYSGSDVQLVAKEAAMRPLRRLMHALETGDEGPTGGAPTLGPILREDAEAALKVTKPTARLYEDRYKQFANDYGQVA